MGEPGIERHFLEDTMLQLRKYKSLAEAALAQVPDDADLFRSVDPESNSIALVMKHVSGNMRSRWTDFLTTDGEKDRNRDAEFERETADTRASITARWEEGWRLVFSAVGGLSPADLSKTVAIRGEPHTVLQAIQRQLTHYSYHVGQIVFLARHFAGTRWRSLSIPKGKSKEFDVARNGRPYALSEETR
jgi:hypothetical protein